MSVHVPAVRLRGGGLAVARFPIPIVLSKGSVVPMAMLAALFALASAGAGPLLLAAAAALGGVGGALSLIVHELGHVRAARGVRGVRPISISLIWMGAGTTFEGAYRSGRDQARVAVAGPAASLGFAIVLLVAALVPMPRPMQYGLFGLVLLNVAIGALSLLPVHPLDGHKVLVGLLWRVLGSERGARSLVRRAGKAWLAVEGIGCLVLLVERPFIGSFVVVAAAAVYAQRHLARAARRAG